MASDDKQVSEQDTLPGEPEAAETEVSEPVAAAVTPAEELADEEPADVEEPGDVTAVPESVSAAEVPEDEDEADPETAVAPDPEPDPVPVSDAPERETESEAAPTTSVAEDAPADGPEPAPEDEAEPAAVVEDAAEAEPEPSEEPPTEEPEEEPAHPHPAGRTRRAWLSGEPSAVPESAAALTADRLLEPRRAAPEGGWRRWLYTLTGGRLNPGDSARVRARRLVDARVQAVLPGGARFVATLTRKGGVGKTTVTTLIGMMMASLREDRVVAVDANPDRGTLAERVPRSSDATVRDIVRGAAGITSFTQLSTMVSRDASRLDVVASETDPAVAEAFGEDDYDTVANVLSRFYSIILTDSGTGMVHSVMSGTLKRADELVLVSGASVDESRLASETLTWLEAHGREDLVRRAVVVLNASNPEARAVDTEEIADHFRSRVRSVVHVPYDPHLAEGATIRLDRLRPATLEAVRELAAELVDGLVEAPRRTGDEAIRRIP